MLAACAARRWLARNAAGVEVIPNQIEAAASACTSLVSCLPALEDVALVIPGPLSLADLGCLLEALAWCPRLRALDLSMIGDVCMMSDEEDDVLQPFAASGCMPAFAKLRSLTKLALFFDEEFPYTLANVVGALMSLTGLMELELGLVRDAVVPASGAA